MKKIFLASLMVFLATIPRIPDSGDKVRDRADARLERIASVADKKGLLGVYPEDNAVKCYDFTTQTYSASILVKNTNIYAIIYCSDDTNMDYNPAVEQLSRDIR